MKTTRRDVLRSAPWLVAAPLAALSLTVDSLVDTGTPRWSSVGSVDLGITEGNFDYVVVADFDSPDDYVVYRDHPVHTAVISELIAGRVAERAAVQYHC